MPPLGKRLRKQAGSAASSSTSGFCILWELDQDIVAEHLIPLLVMEDDEDVLDPQAWRLRRLWRLLNLVAQASPPLLTQALLPALARCSPDLFANISMSSYSCLRRPVFDQFAEPILAALHGKQDRPLRVDLWQCMHCRLPYGGADMPSRLRLCENSHDCWTFHQRMALAFRRSGAQVHVGSIGISKADASTGMGKYLLRWVADLRLQPLAGTPREFSLDDFFLSAGDEEAVQLLQGVLHAWPYARITVGKIHSLNDWRQSIPHRVLEMLPACHGLEDLDLSDMGWRQCTSEDLRCLARIPGLKQLSIRMTYAPARRDEDGTSAFLRLLSCAMKSALSDEKLHGLETVMLTFQDTSYGNQIHADCFSEDYMPALKRVEVWCEPHSLLASHGMRGFLEGLQNARAGAARLLDCISVWASFWSRDLVHRTSQGGLWHQLTHICKKVDIRSMALYPAAASARRRRLART